MAKPTRTRTMGGVLLAAAALAVSTSGTAVAANPPGCVPVPGSLGVEFVLDNSSSNAPNAFDPVGTDPTGLRFAAANLGLDQLPDGDWAGVSKFDAAAAVLVAPAALNATSRAAAKAIVSGSNPVGVGTNYEASFTLAKTELDKVCTEKKAVIFLSDGRPTQGNPNPQNHKLIGAPVYTIALGPDGAANVNDPPGGTNETTRVRLARLATETGGKAFVAANAADLQTAFISAVLAARGIASAAADLTVKPGESGEITTEVPAGQAKMSVAVTWPIGAISVSLVDPAGTVYSASAPGVTFTSGAGTTVDVANPAVGAWKVRAQGVSGPATGMGVTIRVTLTAAAGGPSAQPIVSTPGSKVVVSALKLKGKLVRGKKAVVSFTLSEGAQVKVRFVIKGAKGGTKSISFLGAKGVNTVTLPAKFLPAKAKAGSYKIDVVPAGGTAVEIFASLAKIKLKK